MSKKISFLLILFMVGSWCVFAEEEESDPMIAVWIVLGIGVLATIVIIAVGGTSDDVNKLWYGEANGDKSITPTAMDKPIMAIMDNPIVKHTVFNIGKDNKTFVGIKFAW
jgi:hypothetical protein